MSVLYAGDYLFADEERGDNDEAVSKAKEDVVVQIIGEDYYNHSEYE